MANGPAEIATRFLSIPMQAMVVAVAVLMLLLLRRRRSGNDPLKRYLMPNPPRDTVVLHQYGKGYTVPSISPFVIKLETYLKVANIPYINQFSRQPGPKGKLPWIQYNDQVVADSQFCIEFLNQEMKIELNKNLNRDQLAIGHLIRRTAEESLYWAMITWRLLLERTGLVYKKLGLPSAVVWYLRRAARSGLRSQGIARHTEQEVMHMMEEDLQALSHILGNKPFLFGNEVSQVTEFDCALFGQLSQLVWQMPGTPVENILAEKYPNLVEFCERMKSAFWPEWNDRIVHRPDESSDEDSSTTTSKQAQGYQIIPKNNVPEDSLATNSVSRKSTSLLPRKTSSMVDSVETVSGSPVPPADGKTFTNKHDKERSAPGVMSFHINRSNNKTITARTNQDSTSSILTRRPSLCLQQPYYHDLMTF